MRALAEMECGDVTTLFTDIDDTLTTDGRLAADAYGALEALQRAGLQVIPVTGRPAGWCDQIARLWPVDGIIGENGAFYMWHDHAAHKLHTRHLLDPASRAGNKIKLAAVRQRILAEVPGCAVASDQFCRLYDLAIDFCEDVSPLPDQAVQRIVQIMEEEGMTAKISSIHVNGWFGDYDKLFMAQLMMRELHGIDLADQHQRQRCVFAGDSPNDGPMFAYFPRSVGVANVLQFADRLAELPHYITEQPCGAGFTELSQHLLAQRRS